MPEKPRAALPEIYHRVGEGRDGAIIVAGLLHCATEGGVLDLGIGQLIVSGAREGLGVARARGRIGTTAAEVRLSVADLRLAAKRSPCRVGRAGRLRERKGCRAGGKCQFKGALKATLSRASTCGALTGGPDRGQLGMFSP